MAGRWRLRPGRLPARRTMKTIRTATLAIGYEESGPAAGQPVILLPGFPDDVHAYDRVPAPPPHEADPPRDAGDRLRGERPGSRPAGHSAARFSRRRACL